MVTDKIAEQKTIEFKEKLSIGGREETAEFLADISSFANASGGDIIFGISDERDASGNPTGIPAKIVALQIENASSECNRIEQIVETGLQPRIPVFHVKAIDIPEHGPVIVARIGKSWVAPHMVTYGNRSRFYSRNSSTGKVQLDVQQIGAAFAAQRDVGERLRAWKAGRIAKAVADDGPIALHGSRILFHFVSARALIGEQTFPRIFEQTIWQQHQVYRLMSLSMETERYNADGYLVVSKLTDDGLQSYLQIFRDGSLEYGDSYSLAGGEDISGKELEGKIKRTLVHALALLERLETANPIYTSVTLIAVKGRRLKLPSFGADFRGFSEAFDRDLITSPDVLLQNLSEGQPYPTSLRPVVDSIWQAAGLAATPFLRQDGTWYDPT
ncbi:hypothetical protein HNQ77_002699 [Silvibacterium bohemicum]|uniref:Schlafen AlbA-2 domain-containing protein n=1 Tax=Silvibacterium bohemicum TaxID=1577686 RepID=A0A841JTL0_9BACT|nr:hypothetical protein [Silvibacterium bohemicum]